MPWVDFEPLLAVLLAAAGLAFFSRGFFGAAVDGSALLTTTTRSSAVPCRALPLFWRGGYVYEQRTTSLAPPPRLRGLLTDRIAVRGLHPVTRKRSYKCFSGVVAFRHGGPWTGVGEERLREAQLLARVERRERKGRRGGGGIFGFEENVRR